MKKLLRTLVALSILSCVIFGQVKTQAPSAEDQLALVRLRARMLDAQKKLVSAQQAFEAAALQYATAKSELDDVQPKFGALLQSVQAKLPAPSKGKVWQPQDDKQMGVVFVEVDEPKKEGQP